MSAPGHLDLDALLDDRTTTTLVCCGSGGVGKTTTAAALANVTSLVYAGAPRSIVAGMKLSF